MSTRNRRGEARPRSGDTRPCPYCRAVMFFQEAQSDDTQTGWFCSCGYRILLRGARKPSMVERSRALGERRAKAFRRSMKVRARAERLLEKSEQLAERRRRKK